MPAIVPSITAYSEAEYQQQIERVAKLAERLHIDLMDGIFTSKRNVAPEQAWWPVGIEADIHLMYKNPTEVILKILEHKPHMVIVHSEADGNFDSLSAYCRQHNVKIGVALLQKTKVEAIMSSLAKIDHVLIFSGDLGSYGGQADLNLLEKVKELKQHRPDLEIGWDGGINNQNISQLASGGIDVFNVGGFIQNSPDPQQAYKSLERIADETGTT